MVAVRPPVLFRFFAGGFLDFAISTDRKEVFLSFDDGPVPEVTPAVLDILQSFRAKATFFCVGSNVQKNPDLFRMIMNGGHSVGNHTFHHRNGWKTGTKDYVEDVKRCRELVPSVLFRPPYGRLTLRQYLLLRKEYRIVMWTVLSGDYHQDVPPEKCLDNVHKYTRPGSIVVFHDSIKAREKVLFTLPKMLEYLSMEGFRFSAI